jgi:chaperone modulatory protein CbpM
MEERRNTEIVGIDIETLETWIDVGWLQPARPDTRELSDLDWARARMIRDFRTDLGVNDEAIPIILNLIDQVHGLRRAMRALIDKQSR